MINYTINSIMEIINIATRGLMVFLVFILIIFMVANISSIDLGPDCNKGFSKFYIIFLSFLMFSKFFEVILGWFISWNIFIALVIISIAMEIYLFNKKSNWKFGILAIILLCSSFVLSIIELFIGFALDSMEYRITSAIVGVLTGFNYLIMGIVILILLGKTASENESLEIFTIPIYYGVVLLFILIPLIKPIPDNAYLLWKLDVIPYDTYYWISQGVFFLESILFIIGIIFLSFGAVRTMAVPLTFSREKRAQEIPQEPTKFCPECGAPLPVSVQFCIKCGYQM